MTTPLSAILSYKAQVDTRLTMYLIDKRRELARINAWGEDAIDRLKPFVIAGKTIRGSLVIYTHNLFQKQQEESVYDAAAALELFHSGFLIHDDIMDRDSVRRGLKAMHRQVGVNMAINIGDLCFFLGYQLLPQGIATMVSRELQSVTVAQMQDIAKRRHSKPDLLSLYTYKTARYTFSLPMMIGATLAHASQSVTEQLSRLGESIGILYQIRDDELDEGKSRLASLKSPVLENAEKEISALPIAPSQQQELVSLAHFCLTRDK
jgi:geranylgeranyl diphosphate synthase type I